MARTKAKRVGRRFGRRPTRLLAFGLAMSLSAAGALAAVVLPSRPAPNPAASLSVRTEPSIRTVVAGASASYAVSVSRPSRGPISLSGLTGLALSDRGLPAGAVVSFSPRRGLALRGATRKRTTLTVTTAAGTPAGTYTLRLRARRPHRRGSAAISLVVSAPAAAVAPASPTPTPATPAPTTPPMRAPEAFTISGSLATPLIPGSGEPLDLSLTNHEGVDLSITGLTVALELAGAPQSDSGHACGVGDFAVEQFSGASGFTLPASATATLAELGFAPTELPRVSMLDLPLNQDGCKGASLSLSFAGTATEVTQ